MASDLEELQQLTDRIAFDAHSIYATVAYLGKSRVLFPSLEVEDLATSILSQTSIAKSKALRIINDASK